MATEPEMRHERKFVVRAMRSRDIEHVIKLNPEHFREAYPPRTVNNIYLDSPGRQSFLRTLNGLSRRVKARIRWYGEMPGRAVAPTLELKIRNGDLGWKIQRPLPDFTLGPSTNRASILALLGELEAAERQRLHLSGAEPSLLNSYRRRYYLSASGHLRLTLDSDLRYRAAWGSSGLLGKAVRERHRFVVELKYAPDATAEAQRASQAFRFRLSRNSKYATGVAGTDWRFSGAYRV